LHWRSQINDLENHECERGEIDDRHKLWEVTPLGAMRKVDKKPDANPKLSLRLNVTEPDIFNSSFLKPCRKQKGDCYV